MPDSHFIEVAARLRQVVDGVGALPTARRIFVEELIGQNELGLALEVLSETLEERGSPIEPNVLTEIQQLVDLMGLDSRVVTRLKGL